jgi:uncharacterized membrane protein YbaN (DUF454 family)
MNHKRIAEILRKLLFGGIGCLFLLIGLVFLVMPIPEIPFLIAAAFMFYKMDEKSKISLTILKVLDKLKMNKYFGRIISRLKFIKVKA